jgi:uncharacterized protein involved in exopolysaccharide biosynthesis
MSVVESPGEERLDLRALLGAVSSRWLRIVLVTVLLLGTTYALLMFVPKLYESSASMLVEQRANAFTRSANEQQQANSVTMDSLMASQVELIKSRDTLLAVIEELKNEGRDFLLVTHEMGFARQVADRVAFLADGRIVEHAPAAELFAQPQSQQCRDFLARVLRY